MPKERDLGNSPPDQEVEMSPEFWDGHSFDDTCRWSQQYPDYTLTVRDAFRDRRDPALKADEERRKAVAKEVLDRAIVGNLLVVESIPPGDLFDGNNYPEETLIRYHTVHIWRDTSPSIGDFLRWAFFKQIPPTLSNWQKPQHFSGYYLGVVTDSTYYPELHRKRLIYANEFGYNSRYSRARRLDFEMRARIVVGKVAHERTRHDPLGIDLHESLEKVTSLDILRIEPKNGAK